MLREFSKRKMLWSYSKLSISIWTKCDWFLKKKRNAQIRHEFFYLKQRQSLGHFQKNHTPISVIIIRIQNLYLRYITQNMFEFITNKNMIVSQQFLGRFRPRNETIGSLKFSSWRMNDQFVFLFGLLMNRASFRIFCDISTFLIFDLLFFCPDSNESLSAGF